MENKVIGIEGMVASGKTSICKELTELLKNSIFIDGGAIYRGIVLAISKAKQELESIDKGKANLLKEIMSSPEKLANVNAFKVMKMLNIEFKIENKMTIVYINGKEITEDEIQTMENSTRVSEMASKVNNNALYEFARNIIEEYKKQANIIVSARDLVKIYPDMTCHIFVTATLEERVNRRYAQYDGKYSKEEITNIIIKRDEIHKKAGYDKVGNKNVDFDVTNYKSAHEATVGLLNKLIEENYLRREDIIWENM